MQSSMAGVIRVTNGPQPYTVTLNTYPGTHLDTYFNFLQVRFCPVVAGFMRMQQFINI